METQQLDVLQLFTQFANEVEKGRKLPAFTRSTQVKDLGIDSVALMEIIGCFEDRLNIRIPDEKLATLQTIGDLERLVTEHAPRTQTMPNAAATEMAMS